MEIHVFICPTGRVMTAANSRVKYGKLKSARACVWLRPLRTVAENVDLPTHQLLQRQVAKSEKLAIRMKCNLISQPLGAASWPHWAL